MTNKSFWSNKTTAAINKNVGGIPFLLEYLAVYLPYIIGTILATLVGIAANLCVIASVMTNKNLKKNPTCILIMNLAFSEFIMSAFIHPWMVVGMVLGSGFFEKHSNWCSILSGICLVCCCSSLITMGFLAVNRYIRIFYFRKYAKVYAPKNTVIMCLTAWLFGIIVDFPTILGSARHVYDQKTLTCTLDRLKVSFMLPVIVVFIFLPSAFIYPIYLRIFCYAYRMRLTVSEKKTYGLKKAQSTLKAIKIAQNLFVSFIVLIVCWIPASIVIIVGQDDQLPNWTHAFSNLLAHLNAALNPLLYLTFNPLIRKGFRKLIWMIRNTHVLVKYRTK